VALPRLTDRRAKHLAASPLTPSARARTVASREQPIRKVAPIRFGRPRDPAVFVVETPGGVGGFDGERVSAVDDPPWMRCPATTRVPRQYTRRDLQWLGTGPAMAWPGVAEAAAGEVAAHRVAPAGEWKKRPT
jgi:hypothetical protein